jgi:type I restriction enzyme R subunit
MQKEAQSRIKINELLKQSGWRFFDDEKGKANILLENNTKITKTALDELGDNFEKSSNGFIDFLLLDSRGFPIVVLEAKAAGKDPLIGKEQARKYAKSQNVRFVVLSNGDLHYFWDLEHGNPNIITSFPSLDSLEFAKSFQPRPESIVREQVNEDYIVTTQMPLYREDPRWDESSSRQDFIRENDLKFLRDYQLKAVHSLQNAVKQGKERFLFEMATGTGKTLISAAVIKLFLRTGNARRVLFLVDRLELEDQAKKNFVKYLRNDFKTIVYKENRDDWRKAEIVVTTVQSLSFNNKYQRLFSPTDFDLLISDEAHRSIGGNSRAVFEYFIGYKLGLTATPKDYLKKIDPSKVGDLDPREWERRQMLDTYKTFGCESGNPTYRYSLVDGVKDGHLINPFVVDARTEITTDLLSEKGYAVVLKNEDDSDDKQLYFQTDFEKKFFSEETNKVFCKTFLENAFCDHISGEIGKSIVFCVSQKHASKITQILNHYSDAMFPGKYNSDFAVQVTSSIPDAQQFTINFTEKNNNLNGNSLFIEGYKTSKSRVCVTVGMMTTGYDCQDILNIGLMRPIFSPTDFIQIKGRGTRKFTFLHRVKKGGEVEETRFEKEKFKLFDFFANCEYFEDKYNYDEILDLPKIGGKKSVDPPPPGPEFTSFIPDPLKTITETTVGADGMKVDRMFFNAFENKVKTDPVAIEKFESGNIEAVEEYIKNEIFDKPEEYFNLEKLRKSLKLDRRVGLREIIEKVFGTIPGFKSKDELLDDEFEKFIAIHKPDNKYIAPIKKFLKAYITDSEVRDIVEKKEFSRFATNPKVSMNDYKVLNGWRDVIPEYVKDYVSLNTFM